MGWLVVEEVWTWLAQGNQEVAVGVGVGVEEDDALVGTDEDVVGKIVIGVCPVVREEVAIFGGVGIGRA